MRKVFAFALLAFAGGAMAAEAVLVHDIAPRIRAMRSSRKDGGRVARRTQGTLTIASSAARFSIRAGVARCGAEQDRTATFVNSAFFRLSIRISAFSTYHLRSTDALMAKPGVAEGVLALVRGYVERAGLKVLGDGCAARTPS